MRLFSFLIVIAASACATASAPAESPEALRGCWIERRGAETLTMRWFPDRVRAGAWRGDLLSHLPDYEPSHQGFRLEPAAEGAWRLCPLDDGMPEGHGPPCRDAFLGPGAETEANGGEWMELRATAEALRFTHHVGDYRAVFFNGARDGCD